MQCFGSLWREKNSSSSPPKLRKLRKMSIDEQFEDFEANSTWQKLFLVLKSKSEKQTAEFTTEEAKKAESKLRNRFRDVLPYDQTRVVLQPCCKTSSDYINASFVQVPSARRSYICSQGPLTTTVGHLWEMIWTQNSPAIVMLNSLIEKGMPTCAAYWPQSVGASLAFDDSDQCHELSVTLLNETENPVYVTRSIKLSRRKKDPEDAQLEERTVTQFHFTNWPDFGVPNHPDEFLDFLFAVRQAGCFDVKPSQQECEPVVVHCTAGIGRTGTFVLVDVCLALLALYRAVDIPAKLLELRAMRMGFVQTHEQLRFCYQAIMRGKKRIDIQTPAASPSLHHRPTSLQMITPEPDSTSVTPLPESGSPRRELLRQDGRTPSLDVFEALQNGKRPKMEGDLSPPPSSDAPTLLESTVKLPGATPSSVADPGSALLSALHPTPRVPSPSGSGGVEVPPENQSTARDSMLRQKRQERAEQLRKKVEMIKWRQVQAEDAASRLWKPWMTTATMVGVAALAVFMAYQKLS